MIFSELYGAYYNTVAEILKTAHLRPVTKEDIRKAAAKHAFDESVLNIEPAFENERWQLLYRDGTTPLKNNPTMPLTTLQRRWLKAIGRDPRIKLFTDEKFDFPDVEPLFEPDDIFVFDKYSDGDKYEDEKYIENFRLILSAIREKYPLFIKTTNSKGRIVKILIMPKYLEYSEKDDKFRLIGASQGRKRTINLGRIIYCSVTDEKVTDSGFEDKRETNSYVEFELVDKRNALERALMHFAHFEKQAEKLDDERYRVRVAYSENDETEIVIRILSFGPLIKVSSPGYFIDLIKERLKEQKSCER